MLGVRVLIYDIYGIFNLVVFKVILGSFGTHVSKRQLTQTWLFIKQNRPNLGLANTSDANKGYL